MQLQYHDDDKREQLTQVRSSCLVKEQWAEADRAHSCGQTDVDARDPKHGHIAAMQGPPALLCMLRACLAISSCRGLLLGAQGLLRGGVRRTGPLSTLNLHRVSCLQCAECDAHFHDRLPSVQLLLRTSSCADRAMQLIAKGAAPLAQAELARSAAPGHT